MPPWAFRYPRDVRESPIFAMIQLLSLIIAHVKVVPEKSVSTVDSGDRKDDSDQIRRFNQDLLIEMIRS